MLACKIHGEVKIEMIAIFVSIRVKPGMRDRFVEETFSDAAGSVRDEPGCFRFDILTDDNDPDLVHLYEVYADAAAIDKHRTMPHYTEWAEKVADWRVGDAERVAMTTAFPSDDGWRRQKPYLPE